MADDGLLAGRYRRVRALGRGAMGEVWLADDIELERQVAIKTVRIDGADVDALALDRMVREARVAARLHHRHAVVVHDLIRSGGQPHVIMEYVDGESLADRVQRTGRLVIGEAARLIGQVAGALAAAHELGIVHRDVKPANILIDASGEAKLADFGIARGSNDSALTNTGQIVGTVAFMAPEVARDGTATPASDVWSLGATLYSVLEGRAPYQGDGSSGAVQILARMMSERIPPPDNGGPATPLIMRMLASVPGYRPSAAEVAVGLANPVAAPSSQPLPSPTVVRSPMMQLGQTVVGPSLRSARLPWSGFLGALRFAVGVNPGSPVASADGHRVYVAHDGAGNDGTITVIDAEDKAVVAQLPVGVGPGDAVLSRDNRTLYIVHEALQEVGGVLAMIDADSYERIAQVPLGTNPRDCVEGHARSELYVAHSGSDGRRGSVAIIDASAHREVGSIAVGPDVRLVKPAPDGRRLFVAHADDRGPGGAVSTLDAAQRCVIGRAVIGANPSELVMSRDGRRLYVTHDDEAGNGGILSVIDAASYGVIGRTAVPECPGLPVESADGRYLYVSHLGPTFVEGALSVIDVATYGVVGVLPLGDDPGDAVLSADGRFVYVSQAGVNGAGGAVAVIDATTLRLLGQIPFIGDPGDVVLAEPHPQLFVVDSHPSGMGGALSVIDPHTHEVVDRVDVGPNPGDPVVSPDGRFVFLTCQADAAHQASLVVLTM